MSQSTTETATGPGQDGKGTLLVFGADGRTGKEIVNLAIARGYKVRGVTHSNSAKLDARSGVEHRTADVMTDDLSPLMEGVDGVVSALGLPLQLSTLVDPPPLYTESALQITRAMILAGLSRLVVISAAFVDKDTTTPVWFEHGPRKAMRHVYRQMGDMERLLRAQSTIDWTAVRPGWLLDEPLTQDYLVEEDILPDGTLRTRHADLADFMLDCLEGSEWIGRTPAVARKEKMKHETPPALAREFMPV